MEIAIVATWRVGANDAQWHAMVIGKLIGDTARFPDKRNACNATLTQATQHTQDIRSWAAG